MRRIKLCSDCGSPTPHHLRYRVRSPLCGACYYSQHRKTRPVGNRREANRRYANSVQGKLRRQHYELSAKGLARLKRYRVGAKYKSTVRQYESTDRRKTLKKLWETAGRWKVPGRLEKGG